MKIALVHDFLTQDGGAEKVLKVFQDIYPTAPTYTLIYDRKKANEVFLNKDIRTSFLQKFPLGVRKYQWYLPIMPMATERYDLMDYDVILSSSSAFAKGIITRPDTLHICYCHTPTRYLWTDTHTYIKELKYNSLLKKLIPPLLTRIRIWDRIAADRVDKFIANSRTVQKRIAKYYNRKSNIIQPPVETQRFYISKPENYFLAGGRLVGYKRFDIIVQAFNKLGLPLKIFGEGPEFENIKSLAKQNVELLGKVTDKELKELYSKAVAFIHPQEEDFGIMAVESMAAGRPVIAYAKGGALETISNNKTGKFFEDQEWESLADTIIRFKPEEYNPYEIKSHACQFDVENFKKRIKNYISESCQEFQGQIKNGLPKGTLF